MARGFPTPSKSGTRQHRLNVAQADVQAFRSGGATIHRPEVRHALVCRRLLLSDQSLQPIHGVRILFEPSDLAATNVHRRCRTAFLASQQRIAGLVPIANLQPGAGHGKRQRRLETVRGVGHVRELPQYERGGQR